MDTRAPLPECLRNAVADTAGTADHKHLLAAEIEFIHRRASPLFVFEV
jgi:hypothetical protein